MSVRKLDTERDDARRAKDRNDNDEPKLAPRRDAPKTDRDDPKLAKLRTEREAPNRAQVKTDKDAPTHAILSENKHRIETTHNGRSFEKPRRNLSSKR